jgi:putative CocE/NonD family hydrolase
MALHTTLLWLPNEAADMINRAERAGQDVSEMRRLLEAMRTRPEAVYTYLPLLEVPIAQFGPIRQLLDWRLQAASQPPQLVRPPYEEVVYPTFHECGWYDGLAVAQLEAFDGLCRWAGTPAARQAQHLVVGPWPHASNFQSILGAINFGPQASSAGSGIYQLQVAFFDRYVRGRQDVHLPRVRYFVMGQRQWREADAWPLPQTSWQRFYLHSRGGANTADGDGVLSQEEPGAEPPDRFIYDPLRPVPTVGGPLVGQLEGPGIIAGPLEQSRIEGRQDVLCYTTPELAQPIEITGPLTLHLCVSTSTRDTDFCAKLVDVYPDGQAYNLAEGILRLSGRAMNGTRQWAEPGEVYALDITLGPTSQHFAAGHRIRLQITSSNFPQYDRNMNTGGPIGTEASGVPALQTIFHERGQASYIDLPLIGI